MATIDVKCGDRAWGFENDPNGSLLDQLIANSVPINYSCRRGDCGQCAVDLVEGSVAALEAKQNLWQSGSLLPCNAVACSSLSVRIPHDPELEGISVLRSPAKIHGLKRLSNDVMELTLRLPPANEIRYLPGQYIRLTNREGTTRSYSLAAGPAADRMLRVHVRRVNGGAFSHWLFERATVSELLHVEGPQGRFFLHERDSVSQTIFLATGTGIAPIWAMLSSATEGQRQQMGLVSIYWGNRERADAYMTGQLEELSAQLGFRFMLICSRGLDAAPVFRHVQDQMLAEHPCLSDAQIFACGSSAMIEGARAVAMAAGLLEERFYSDPFTAS